MPKFDPEDSLVVYLFNRILPGLSNGMGGYNFQAIDSILDKYRINREAQPELYDKILVMISAISEIWKAKQ